MKYIEYIDVEHEIASALAGKLTSKEIEAVISQVTCELKQLARNRAENQLEKMQYWNKQNLRYVSPVVGHVDQDEEYR